MDLLIRILSYSRNLTPRLVLFFIFMVLGIIFGAFNLVLIIPMLEVLFQGGNAAVTVPPLPDFSVSSDYVLGLFNHYFMLVIDRYGAREALLFICGLIVVCVLLANTFRCLERVIATKIRVDLVRRMRMHIFERVSLLHIGYFNNERKGDLISRFTGDVMEVESAVINLLRAVVKDPITLTVYFVMLFLLSPKLTMFTLIVLPLSGWLLATIVNSLKRQAKLSQESLGRMVNILDETFSGMRVVKAFNARNFIINRLKSETDHYRKVNKSMAYKNEMAAPVSEIMGVAIVAVIIYFGGSLVLANGSEFKPSEFMGFLALFTMIIQPAKSFANGITQLQKGLASARRIFALTDTESMIRDKSDAQRIDSFDHEITFDGVWFAYQQDHVLKDINLVIPKGKTIALVGPSGGGKSTLADLVPRFYDPGRGAVKIDGIPLPDLKMESLRSLIGVVTQESILFHDTIFNNIAFGMPDATEEAVINAARVANAHDFIMQTEHGYHTIIGERGSKLSGGQRQRLSIARAVLKNPPILILDEATSALDTESEKLVQEALFNLMEHRTSLVIAHRLSTIQHADEIIVVQNGTIAERGTHQALMTKDGLYRKLTEIQRA
ncbi:MAG: ABC transporter ATP-binding protein [Bacteroidota bacterium]